jgi:zinc transporter 2/zinc transporter 4
MKQLKNTFVGHTFGFHRAEVIAALVSVLTIWILTAFLVHEAIQRIKYPQEINAKLVMKQRKIDR